MRVVDRPPLLFLEYDSLPESGPWRTSVLGENTLESGKGTLIRDSGSHESYYKYCILEKETCGMSRSRKFMFKMALKSVVVGTED